ncbi:pilus assembly protein [Ralstonia soli]|uniref:PilC/PilY family type IV pilus protein n=1 Tax=Ralstonia soli TaxID=2953896 RepID=A0ABT1AJH2_9RALS|nr:PilC/PilY family type IV pilus protein [Ralstonia soli]MCO5398446.1 PilC/PilY family type IV pilus protein [Ralstonia soli]
MNKRRVGAWLVAALASSTPAATSDNPADLLPTHIIAVRGGDAWSGRLRALQFQPTLGTLDAPAPPDLWEAGALLGDMPPDTRQLWTFRHGEATAHKPVALRWDALSPAQQAEIDGGDGLGTARVDYLLGVRDAEHDGAGLRPRSSILGNMRGAHVQLLGPPGFVFDARHASFRQDHARRPWMVYIGANDGLLHAFDARTGEERFAVMSDAVLPTAARNASPGRPVPGPVCSRPFASDAWTGSQWRSVLACGNGAMGTGLFLVDVTDPTSSGPRSLFAYDATDDPTVGHIEGPIPIVPLTGSDAQPRWFAISGNGHGDPAGESRLLLLALDQPVVSAWQPNSTAYAVSVPSTAGRGGLGAPVVALGPNGRGNTAYAPDANGNVWRFDLSGAPPWDKALGKNSPEQSTPFFTAMSHGKRLQRVLGPMLLAATTGGPLLVFTAVDASGHATLYGVVDGSKRGLSREDLVARSVTDTVGDVADSARATNGWHIDLPTGEMPEDLATADLRSLMLTTRDTTGHQRAYLLDPVSGLATSQTGGTGHVVAGTPLITTLDTPPTQTPNGISIQATHTTLWQLDGDDVRQLETRTYTRQLGRLSWREMTEMGAH